MSDDKKIDTGMSMNPRIERDRQFLLNAKARGGLSTFGAFVRLSGPGWLQSAVTLGGGSLASSMYLGVLVGFSFLWLQPVAMVAGIVMLSAIAYVTLSTDEKPLHAINRHVSPVLGWGWLLASMLANLVWSMTQIALASASLQQNLLPDVLGAGAIPDPWGRLLASGLVIAVAFGAVMLYTVGGWGMRLFEIVVKCLVGMVVVCFIGVVVKLVASGRLHAGEVFGGFVPDLSLLSKPVGPLAEYIKGVQADYQGFWNGLIVGQQRDIMISAAATAVGINMTFLFPYSMLRKGWDRDFRGLAIFDLSTGLFFPFVLATSCVVIAAAAQFHAAPAPGFFGEVDASGRVITPSPTMQKGYDALLAARLENELGQDAVAALSAEEKQARAAGLPEADRKMAAMLVRRDAIDLAASLSPLVGDTVARYVFGFGTLGMGMGALTMLMLINGLCLCEMFNRPARGWLQRLGAALVCFGALGPFFWKDAQMYLAIPTSMFAMTLLPLAYLSFLILMNQRRLLGDNLPRGARRVWWNVLMIAATGLAAFGSLWSIWAKTRWIGLSVAIAFGVLVLLVHVARRGRETAPDSRV